MSAQEFKILAKRQSTVQLLREYAAHLEDKTLTPLWGSAVKQELKDREVKNYTKLAKEQFDRDMQMKGKKL